MINRLIRHIKEGITNIVRHSAMSIASATAVTITLILVSLVLIIMVNVSQLATSVERQLEIRVKISTELDSAVDILALRTKIEEIDGVVNVNYSTKAQELDRLIAAYPELASIYDSYRDRNPLYDAFYVEVKSGDQLTEISNTISGFDYVYSVDFGGDGVIKLVDMLNNIRSGGLILVAALTVLAIFLIANTIKITILSRIDEISIMRTVGATNAFIRAPFLVEGCLIGLLGAAIPITASLIGYYYFAESSGGYLFTEIFALVPFMPFAVYLASALGLFGMFVGFLGSFISVTRYLRWKR